MYPYITIFGITLGSYGIMMALGVLTAGILCILRAKSRNVLWEDILVVAGFAIGLALLLGAAFYAVVTYPIDYILNNLITGQFHNIKLGIVFYGGLFGGIFGALIGARVAKCAPKKVIQVALPIVPLGHAIGRVGCVLAGCCYGLEYNGPFALHYPNAVSGVSPEIGCFPVQLLEATLNLMICIALVYYEKKNKNCSWDLLFLYLGLYSVVRFLLEFLRGDEIRGIAAGLSSSQWISIALMMGCCFYIMVRNIEKHR